jgi:peptidoglycan hydrolase CwlO-like protein
MHRGLVGRAFVRALSTAIVLMLLAGTAIAGPAETRKKIAQAKARLHELQSQIVSQEARVLELNDQLKIKAAEVAVSRHALDEIQARLVQTMLLRRQAAERYQALRDEIDRAARDAYIRGPAFAVEALLDLASLGDVADVLSYTSAIADHNAQLADEVTKLAFELKTRSEQESQLQSERTAAVTRLTGEQNALTERFVEQQMQLGSLNQARAEVGTLLVKLRDRLRAEEIAAAEEALRHGTPLTFGQWADRMLGELRAPVARNNLVVMVAWQVAEYTQARWNPLATTYPMPGATEFNSSGVRNYVSLGQGLDATRLTLQHCCYGYEQILVNLARNADPMTTAEAINASRWCRGCANGGYVVDLIPTIEQYYDEYAAKSA